MVFHGDIPETWDGIDWTWGYWGTSRTRGLFRSDPSISGPAVPPYILTPCWRPGQWMHYILQEHLGNFFGTTKNWFWRVCFFCKLPWIWGLCQISAGKKCFVCLHQRAQLFFTEEKTFYLLLLGHGLRLEPGLDAQTGAAYGLSNADLAALDQVGRKPSSAVECPTFMVKTLIWDILGPIAWHFQFRSFWDAVFDACPEQHCEWHPSECGQRHVDTNEHMANVSWIHLNFS